MHQHPDLRGQSRPHDLERVGAAGRRNLLHRRSLSTGEISAGVPLQDPPAGQKIRSDGRSARASLLPHHTEAALAYDGPPRQLRRIQLRRRRRPVEALVERPPFFALALRRRIHGVKLLDTRSPAMDDAIANSVPVQRTVGLTAQGTRTQATIFQHARLLRERVALDAGLPATST